MAYKLKLWWVVLILFLILNLLHGEPQVPCFFIFGDSLNENGNNNHLRTTVKSHYPPHWIVFPKEPTRRFHNGPTYADVIAELLGFDDYIPPYAIARGQNVLKGVNYASAGTGIRDEFERIFGDRISFNHQLKNHINIVSQVANTLGNEYSASNYLRKCIYLVQIGSSDYLYNYFMSKDFSTSQEYTLEKYADVLIEQYSKQLRILYNYGASKVILAGVGLVGCLPSLLAQNCSDGSSCVEKINSAIGIFNNKLIPLIDDFNNNLADAKFIYVNHSGITKDIMKNPSVKGFQITNAACYGLGRNKGQQPRLPFQIPFLNRIMNLFWDLYHPTKSANLIIGRRSYNAESPSDVYPIDICHLAQH